MVCSLSHFNKPNLDRSSAVFLVDVHPREGGWVLINSKKEVQKHSLGAWVGWFLTAGDISVSLFLISASALKDTSLGA